MVEKRDIHRKEEIEQWLRDEVVRFTYNPHLRLDLIDFEAGLKNQARLLPPGEELDKDTVNKYMLQMKAGAIFPPVIVFKKGSTYMPVDGNQRIGAWRLLGVEDVPAYVLDPKTDINKVMDLAMLANKGHGLNLTPAERLHHALFQVSIGTHNPAEAANNFGLSVSTVRDEQTLRKAQSKASAVGIPTAHFRKLPLTAQRRLTALKTDQAFKALSLLAIEAGIPQGELSALVTEVNKLRTDKARLDFITGELTTRYQDRGFRPKTQKTAKNTLLLHAKSVIRVLDNNQDQLVQEITDPEKDDYLTVAYQLIKRLDEFANDLVG